MARSKTKPILWLLFASGGTIAALFFPVLIFTTGVLLPQYDPDWFNYTQLKTWISIWWVKLCIFIFITPVLWHSVHRFYLTLKDVYLIEHSQVAKYGIYGIAVVGTIVLMVSLFTIK